MPVNNNIPEPNAFDFTQMYGSSMLHPFHPPWTGGPLDEIGPNARHSVTKSFSVFPDDIRDRLVEYVKEMAEKAMRGEVDYDEKLDQLQYIFLAYTPEEMDAIRKKIGIPIPEPPPPNAYDPVTGKPLTKNEYNALMVSMTGYGGKRTRKGRKASKKSRKHRKGTRRH